MADRGASSLWRLLGGRGGLALHLPAHGRGRALAPELRRLLHLPPARWDLPELPALGGPLEPHGAVAEAQEACANLLGADRCWFGVNGASGLLQAAALAVAPPGSRLLLPRNLHRSLLHACVLGGIEPLIFDLPFDPATGLWQPATAEHLERVLAQAMPLQPAALVLVDPTYQGLQADLTALVACLRRWAPGLPLLVDEAHGQGRALAAGADLMVLSHQKAGSGLAQSALLALRGDRLTAEALEASSRALGLEVCNHSRLRSSASAVSRSPRRA
ncbi:MAG: lysine decarboxylase, partial [Cyanobium sp.]